MREGPVDMRIELRQLQIERPANGSTGTINQQGIDP
jgi:hypothetical protein